MTMINDEDVAAANGDNEYICDDYIIIIIIIIITIIIIFNIIIIIIIIISILPYTEATNIHNLLFPKSISHVICRVV